MFPLLLEKKKPRSGTRNGVCSSSPKSSWVQGGGFKLLLFLYHQRRRTSTAGPARLPAPSAIPPARRAAGVGAPLAKVAIRAGMFLFSLRPIGTEEQALRRHFKTILPLEDEFPFPWNPLPSRFHAHAALLISHSDFQERGKANRGFSYSTKRRPYRFISSW